MDTTDPLPRDAQSILELAARSMFDLFANASEGMMLVDRPKPACSRWWASLRCCTRP